MVVPSSAQLIDESENAIKLARYAQIIEFPECAFFGVRYDNDALAACQHIWRHHERASIARYLNEAQIEIEQVTGYPLSPKWFEQEQQPYQCRSIKTRWSKLLAAGVRAVSNIALNEPVDHSTDPAVVGPVVTTVTDWHEIKVYHPGTDFEIEPSAIAIAGGQVTIEIPRCRLVLAALEDTPQDGLDYDDVGTCVSSFSAGTPGSFECEVDVKRVYTDTTDQGTLVYPHGKSCACVQNCTEDTDAACVYIRDAELGFVDVRRETISSLCTCGARLTYVRMNYQAGVVSPTSQMEDAIIRLAHVKMPHSPCGCEQVTDMWARDRHVPDVLDRERLNCPFGLSDGAWTAWKFANALQVKRASVL